MKRTASLLLTLLMVLALAACGANGSGGATAATGESTGAAGAATDSYLSKEESGFSNTASGTQSSPSADVGSYPLEDAKLIRRAELTVQTDAFDQAVQALDAMLQEYHGYYQQAESSGGSLRDQTASRYGYYVLRLPAEDMDAFLSRTGELGYVTRQQETSENVSQSYRDIETRLQTQRTKQERLLALLEQADTMENIIALEDALSQTEYEIESLTTSLNHSDALIDYATITLNLEEVRTIQTTPNERASLGARLWAGLGSSFSGLLEGGQGLLIWLSYHLFQVLLVVCVAGGGAAAVLRVRGRRKARGPKDPGPGGV